MMGEAKRRGTFEERKAQAIEAGRIKKPPAKIRKPQDDSLSIFSFVSVSAGKRRQRLRKALTEEGGKGDE